MVRATTLATFLVLWGCASAPSPFSTERSVAPTHAQLAGVWRLEKVNGRSVRRLRDPRRLSFSSETLVFNLYDCNSTGGRASYRDGVLRFVDNAITTTAGCRSDFEYLTELSGVERDSVEGGFRASMDVDSGYLMLDTDTASMVFAPEARPRP